MSNQVAKNPTETAVTHSYSILNSYNILTLEHPRDLLTHSVSRAKFDLQPDKYVNVNNGHGAYNGAYKEVSSQFALRRDFSASVGISGRYGLYSADVDAAYSTSYMQKSTSFNSRYKASIDYGNANYRGINPLDDLDFDLVKELQTIGSHAAAKQFVDNYGTHLITQTGLGGLIYISIQAESESNATTESINTSVQGAYNSAAAGIKATATAAIDIATQYKGNNLTETMTAIGGNPFVGPVKGESSSSDLENWASSVTKDSVCKVIASTPYWELVPGSVAAVKLEEYVQSSLLIKSINKPSIFVSSKKLDGNLTSLSTKPDEGFKIISGGGEVDDDNCFMLSTYPDSEGTDQIVQWTVDVHDCLIGYNPDKTVTTYAIGILDPFDLLATNLNSLDVLTTGSGYAKTIPALGVVTGGGVHSKVNSEGKYKWMYGTNPRYENHWHVSVFDYAGAAPNTDITIYALGISCKNGLIDIQRTLASNETRGNHIDQKTTLPAGMNIAGGGIWTVTLEGDGVLTRKFRPGKDNSWESYSQDHAGRISKAYQTLWAIGLTAKGNW